jgi:DMSO reductase family type II enzyme heme b subunit
MVRSSLLPATAALLLAACAAETSPRSPQLQARGTELYARHCAVCHGDDGNAETPITNLLLPRPNAFRQGLFKLVSTDNGMPTNEDLVATLRRGMPGSTMMSFGWLPAADLEALAEEVRRLTVQGRTETIHRTGAITGQALTVDAARATAERQLAPGATVATAESAPMTAETLAAGEALYRQHCASCHGMDGRGLPQASGWPTDGTWLWPRDFTSGYLRGDTSQRALSFRIRAGMPGAHMPPTVISAVETSALVGFVKSLIPDAAGDRHAQWRRTLRAARLPQLPTSDEDAVLQTIEAVRLPLAPLWWRAEAPSEAWLRVARDEQHLLLQLEWNDATRDDRLLPGRRYGDGVAVQFTTDVEAPLFAMGSAHQPVNTWRWQAAHPRETAGYTDLLSAGLHQGLGPQLDAPPPVRTARSSDSLQFRGTSGAAAAADQGLPLTATAQWRDGRWRATFRRALAPRGDAEVDLRQRPLLVAIAVWDGSIDQHAASKAITNWHTLELAPE